MCVVQEDVWVEVARVRASLPAAGHISPDCHGPLYQLHTNGWIRRNLVLLDGSLYLYKDGETETAAAGRTLLQRHSSSQARNASRIFCFCFWLTTCLNVKVEFKKIFI